MDERILGLFREWLSIFGAVQADESSFSDELTHIENLLGGTPADGLQGVAVKLALHCFLQNHTDANSSLAQRAYHDLVRMSGYDPLVDITTRYQECAPVRKLKLQNLDPGSDGRRNYLSEIHPQGNLEEDPPHLNLEIRIQLGCDA